MKRVPISLQDFIPKVSPRYAAPAHLAPLTDLFERVAKGEEVLACVSCAPRHGKTDSIWHGIAWLLRLRPEMRIAYVTYAQTLSEKKSRRGRMIAQHARVKLDPNAASLHDWRTGVQEGGVWATSEGGPITGEGFDLVVMDDMVKDRVAAESSLIRDRTHAYVTDTLIGRGEPGCSFLNVMHRWNPDDLSGRLIADGWEEINLPALDDNGNALWPARFDAGRLATIRERIGDYTFDGLYMGRPRSRGGVVFNDVHFYDSVPEGCPRIIGVDLNYVVKTRADYSVAIVCAVGPDGTFFVLHVERRQSAAPDFAVTLAALRATYGNPPMGSYVSGTERGTLDFMARSGVPITPMAARADKFNRAQLCAAAWNCGKVRVPREAKWLNAFVEELASFTGVNDRHDDQIDALVSAFDMKAGSVAGAAMIQALQQRRAMGPLMLARDMTDFDDFESLRRRFGY